MHESKSAGVLAGEGATALRKCSQVTCAKGPSCDKRHPSQGGYADDRVNSWLTGNVVIGGGLGGPASARHPFQLNYMTVHESDKLMTGTDREMRRRQGNATRRKFAFNTIGNHGLNAST
jgi:hypothetical protein